MNLLIIAGASAAPAPSVKILTRSSSLKRTTRLSPSDSTFQTTTVPLTRAGIILPPQQKRLDPRGILNELGTRQSALSTETERARMCSSGTTKTPQSTPPFIVCRLTNDPRLRLIRSESLRARFFFALSHSGSRDEG